MSTLLAGCESKSLNRAESAGWFESKVNGLFGGLLAWGFEKKTCTPLEYVDWIEDPANGLLVKKDVGDYNFTILYKPLDYIIIKEKKDDKLKKEDLQTEKSEIEDLQYFTFKIGLKANSGDLLKYNLTKVNDYYARVEYFSFAMQNDLKLLDGNDTLNCILHHFERTFGLAPYCNFVLGFKLSENSPGKIVTHFSDKTLIYNDRVLGIGPIKLTVKGNNIKNIPKLITYGSILNFGC